MHGCFYDFCFIAEKVVVQAGYVLAVASETGPLNSKFRHMQCERLHAAKSSF